MSAQEFRSGGTPRFHRWTIFVLALSLFGISGANTTLAQGSDARANQESLRNLGAAIPAAPTAEAREALIAAREQLRQCMANGQTGCVGRVAESLARTAPQPAAPPVPPVPPARRGETPAETLARQGRESAAETRRLREERDRFEQESIAAVAGRGLMSGIEQRGTELQVSIMGSNLAGPGQYARCVSELRHGLMGQDTCFVINEQGSSCTANTVNAERYITEVIPRAQCDADIIEWRDQQNASRAVPSPTMSPEVRDFMQQGMRGWQFPGPMLAGIGTYRRPVAAAPAPAPGWSSVGGPSFSFGDFLNGAGEVLGFGAAVLGVIAGSRGASIPSFSVPRVGPTVGGAIGAYPTPRAAAPRQCWQQDPGSQSGRMVLC